MERKAFLNKLSGGLAFTCVACMMAACEKTDSSYGNTPSTNPPNTGGGNNNALLTVNLVSQLIAVNDFVTERGVIVVRTATGNSVSSFSAFSSACPHAGATVMYLSNSKSFNCSAHGSNFSSSGSVLNGPALTGLVKLTVEISGTTLSVKA